MTLTSLKSQRGFAGLSTSLELQRYSMSVSPPVSPGSKVVGRVLSDNANEIPTGQYFFPMTTLTFLMTPVQN